MYRVLFEMQLPCMKYVVGSCAALVSHVLLRHAYLRRTPGIHCAHCRRYTSRAEDGLVDATIADVASDDLEGWPMLNAKTYIYIYIYIHTHTSIHTHVYTVCVYIYIYIYVLQRGEVPILVTSNANIYMRQQRREKIAGRQVAKRVSVV